MAAVVQRIVSGIRAYSQRSLAQSLSKYGLRYEDILTEVPTVDTATHRLPEDVREARIRRIKRAVDLSFKRKYLPEQMRDYDPLQPYMSDLLEEAETEAADKREFAH